MGPQHRGRNVGIGLGSGALLGALLGAGGGIAHNSHNKRLRDQLKLQQRLNNDLKQAEKQLDVYKQREKKLKAEQQRQKKVKQHQVKIQQRQDGKKSAQDSRVSDWAQGKIDGYMNSNGQLVTDGINTKYYDYPDSSGDLQDAYTAELSKNMQQYKDSLVDDVFNSNPLLSGNTPQIQRSTKEALSAAFKNAETQLKHGAGMSEPAYLDALRQRIQNRAKELTTLKRFSFGLPEYTR